MSLHSDRYFDPGTSHRNVARRLYGQIASLPLICPHGHVDPALFADESYRFGTPVELFVIPDHYVLRMLYSQGVTLDELGVPRLDGSSERIEHREIWRTFARHFYLFRGTPTGLWIQEELASLFDIEEPLSLENADSTYDAISERLRGEDFTPRRLYERFNVEVLTTTDSAVDDLTHHRRIRDSGWGARILPTFRPDTLLRLDMPGWSDQLEQLQAVTNTSVDGLDDFLDAIRTQRQLFVEMGAVATDHGALSPHIENMSHASAEAIFLSSLTGRVSREEAERFYGYMLLKMAEMSVEDRLIMQLHVGSMRSYNQSLTQVYGRDIGADIPVATDWTRGLHTLLNRFGNHPDFRLILFTLDESTYARELAPLAGHFPALFLGPPWWFHDSLNGFRRFFDRVVETAGIYNTVGFNDDTRAFPSIPARHDMWRRAVSNWLAGLVERSIISEGVASEMAHDLAYSLAKHGYRLDDTA